MAWEHRNGKRVYYRARRVNGKVVKQYFGSGLEAELAAQADRTAREIRDRDRNELRRIKEDMEEGIRLMKKLDEAVRVLSAGTLIGAGFHQHRGHWRKRRG